MESEHDSQGAGGSLCRNAAKPDRTGDWNAFTLGKPAIERTGTRGDRSQIFATNDLIAFGVLKAIRQAELSCPEDVSVFGFDNLDLGDTAIPSLSTVDQFVYKLGARAVQIIVERIGGDKSAAKRIRIPVELRVKNSTAPPSKRKKTVK